MHLSHISLALEHKENVRRHNSTSPSSISNPNHNLQFSTLQTLTSILLVFKMVRTSKYADFAAVSRPFRAHVDIEDVEVEGEIPTELDGTFYRVSLTIVLYVTQR